MSAKVYAFPARSVEVDTAKLRREIREDLNAYIASGGKIERLPNGATGVTFGPLPTRAARQRAKETEAKRAKTSE